MPETLYPWMHLVGRILFSLLFIMGGMMHLTKADQMAAVAQGRGLPAAKLGVYVTGLMIVVGGVLVALGYRRFIGAGLIAIFALLAAFTIHTFWKDTDPNEQANQMSHFLKNLALAGGALFIAHYARYAWPMSMGG